MADYRVYKVGEEDHVREVTAEAPPHLPGRGRYSRYGDASTSLTGRWWFWAVIAAAAVAAAAAYWFFGREAVGNSEAALQILKKLDKVPDWAVLGAPVIVVAAVALVTVYLAIGRHLAVKVVGVVAVVLVLATPGLAVGYANGLVSSVASSAGKTDAEEREIRETDKHIDRPIPHKPMNILLIGSDKTKIPGDTGRSDTQMLVRLDPETKSISMLSLPRDLYVDIPDHGYAKMNEAYAYGGPALVIDTFKKLTGLPINGWIEVNFAGFWHVVNILGGVYLPIDHKYFVPASADYKSINLEPGYQLVRGKQALNYVRFRHDEFFDFGRMQRQQLFLKELQRQSGRWSSDYSKVLDLIRAITGETKSSLSSLKKIEPLVELAFEVDTSKVYQAHLEGANAMVNGASVVEASPEQIADVVHQFTNPTQAPVTTKGTKVSKKMFTVHVYNGSGMDGLATTAASQLSAQGYNAVAEADANEYPDKVTAVYATKDLEAQAKLIAAMLYPSDVRIVARSPGLNDGINVFVASSFDGSIEVPQEVVDQQQQQQTLEKNVKADWSTWKQYDAKTPLKLEAPTAWASGSTYDQWRNYSIETTDGKRSAASVAVVKTPQYGYWSVQAMRWQDPPAIQSPNSTQTIKGRKYMLFYQGDHLHMVAWKEHSTLYWVINTLTNQLSNDLMLGLATSCKPVK